MKVKVTGVGTPYSSLEEAIEAQRELEQLRELEVDELRERGREGEADKKDDQYGRLIENHRRAIRTAQEKDAGATRQPKDRPKKSRRQTLKRTVRARRPRPIAAARAGLTGQVLRETGATAASRSTTRFALQLAGLVIAVAFVIAVLERPATLVGEADEEEGGLLGGLFKAVRIFVDPSADPFEPATWRQRTPAPRGGTTPAPNQPLAARVVRLN